LLNNLFIKKLAFQTSFFSFSDENKSFETMLRAGII
tara:strand:- start:162 stop:269 length:108 start_codon:yes stop_codon:yes gene_type:complete